MSFDNWQAGRIPPSTISGGGDLEYWQAGGIPSMQANPSLQTILANFLSSAASVFAPVVSVGNPPRGGAHSFSFASALSWWPAWLSWSADGSTVATAALASPDDIGGLVGWWDASDISTLFQDTAGTSVVTANGQTVARINDKSGTGTTITQATAGARPTYQTGVQNALAALSFDGGDYLSSTATFDNYPVTILGVARTNATIGVSRGLVTLRHSTNFGTRVLLSSADRVQATVGPADVSLVAAGTVAADTTFLFGMRADASSISAMRDNALTGAPAHSASLVANIVRLGAVNVNTTGTLHQGHIMEVCLYNAYLSASQVGRVGRYLIEKWAVY